MGVVGNESTVKAHAYALSTAGVPGLIGRGAIYELGGVGAPVNGSSNPIAGRAEAGSVYIDFTTGIPWLNVGTEAAPVWSPLEPVPYAVTSANILAMNGAPVTLIAAPPAGYCVIVYSILFEMVTTATQYAGGGAVSFVYHGGSTAVHSGSIPATVINAGAGTSLTLLGSPSASNGTTVPTATGVDITNATAAFTTGTGTAKAFIVYSVIKQ